MAAIAAAVVAALGTAYSADSANSNSLISQAGQGKKPPAGTDYSPTALKFAPGVQGQGDGSMPFKADEANAPGSSGAGSNWADYSKTDVPVTQPSVYSPDLSGADAPPQTASTGSGGGLDTNQLSQLAGVGLSLGQALQGQPLQPMQPHPSQATPYQPTALAALQAYQQRKRGMGY